MTSSSRPTSSSEDKPDDTAVPPTSASGKSKSFFRLPSFRTTVRLLVFVAAIVLLLPLLPWQSTTAFVPAASPFVAIVTAVATRSVGWLTLVGLPVLVAVAVWKRWFCRWGCPVGICTETLGRISPLPKNLGKWSPPLGKAILLVSLGAACAGYPLLLWLDPLALMSGMFAWTHVPVDTAALVTTGVLGGVLILSFLLPNLWCGKICPLGATQDWLALPRELVKSRAAANSAGSERDERKSAAQREPAPAALPRRSVLFTGLAALLAGAGAFLGLRGRASGQNRQPARLRPPGAAPEWQFSQLCLRCGNCTRACPSGIIHRDDNPQTITGYLVPFVAIDSDYCREACVDCTQVCPSGAIQPIAPADKPQYSIGMAHVDMTRCLLALDRECRTMCLHDCPFEAITIHPWTFEDDRRYPIIDKDRCTGCGACQLACTPMDAIIILPPGVAPLFQPPQPRPKPAATRAIESSDPLDDWLSGDADSSG
jgi:ferredoxin-type protein NapF